MAALLPIASLLVPGLPGLAAVRWMRAHQGTRGIGPLDLPAIVAVSYTGIAIAAISLWIAASVWGVSPWTSIGAPAVAALLIAGDTARLRSRRPKRGDGTSPIVASSPDRIDSSTPFRHRVLLACALTSTLLVATPFAPYGWIRSDGVHRTALTDWEKHIVMATAIAGAPSFPPPHPYVRAHAAPSYYFGYHLVAAAMTSIGSRAGDVYPALWMLALITAAATPFVAYLVARDLVGGDAALLAAAGSTLLVGFDAIVLAIDTVRAAAAAWPLPHGLAGLRALIPSTHIDYWIHNVERSFSAPIVSTMWAPHQTVATLTALVTMNALAPRADAPNVARVGAFVPGLLIASLAALSTYVAMSLAVGVAACLVLEWWTTKQAPWRGSVARRWGPAGLLAVLLALPVLPTVLRGSSSGLTLAVSSAGSWSNGALFSWLFGPAQWTWLIDTPAVYAVEFGVIGIAAAVCLARRRSRLTPGQTEAAVIALAVMALVTFVRPPVGIGNNLYARGLLLSWFLLAPFAAITVVEFRRSRLLFAAILVCAMGTAYAEVGYLLEGSLFWAMPVRTVEALRWVNDHTPPSAPVAFRPSEFENAYGYWLRRPLVLGGRRLALLFGADPAVYDRARDALEAAYAEQDGAKALDRFVSVDAATVMLRRETAPAWRASSCLPVVFENADWLVIRPTRTSCSDRILPRDARRD